MNDQDLIDSLSAKSPLEQSNVAHVAADILALLFGVGVVFATGLGFVFAILYLFLGVG